MVSPPNRVLYSRAFFLLAMVSCNSYGTSAATGVFAGRDLEAYLSQALAANPQLKAFKWRYEAAVERIPQASSLPDPVFQVTHFVESVETRTGPQENRVMLSQRIPWFGKLSSRKTVASEDAEALWFAYLNEQLALTHKVSVGYFEYGFIGQATVLTRENLNLLNSLEPVVEERLRAGGEITALLRLKVEIGRVGDRLESLKQQRIAQEARLIELLALPGDSTLEWPLWQVPKPVTLEEPSLVRAIEDQNPELQMLKRKIASTRAREKIARLESFPDMTLGINYIEVGDPAFHSMGADSGRDAWGFTVAVVLPVWFEKRKAGQAEALASKRANENEYDSRYDMIVGQLRASMALLDDAHRRLELYGDDLLGLAEQALEISRTSYESGRTGILEVIDSERTLLELKLFYWRAAADAWQQLVTILSMANNPALGIQLRSNSRGGNR